jgi:hypothetical protein
MKRLTKLEMDAILSAASQMEDEFEEHYNFEDKKFHAAFHSGLAKMREALSKEK